MSINQVIISEGHAGFYSAFGLSLAVLVTPLLQQWIQMPLTGLGPEIESIITLLAFSGVITGLLFVGSPDRIADKWIEGKAKYDSWHEFSPLRKTKKCNQGVQSLIAEIDQTVSNWNRPTWISTSDNCFSIIENVMDAPPIQKTLWELKRKASVGILFFTWAISVRLYLELSGISWILFMVYILGLGIILHTIFRGAATEIVTRVRRFALISYANDSLQNYQPIRYGRRDESVLESINRLKDSANMLEQVATYGEWKRFNATYDNYLYELKTTKPRIASSVHRLQSGTFADYYLSKSKGENVEESKSWFLNVLEAYSINGEIEKIHWEIKPTAQNYNNPKAVFSLNFDDPIGGETVYRNRSNVQSLLIDAFDAVSTDDKVLWINGASEQKHGFPAILRDRIYSFACNYEGNDLTTNSYQKIAANPGRIRDTTKVILERIRHLDVSGDEGKQLKFRFFDKVLNEYKIEDETRETARLFRNQYA